MKQKIFYHSSMPRAGSTLLQNIMAQNPNFYCSPTSGLLELIYGARKNYTDCPEFKAQNKDEMKKAFLNFCKSAMAGYYNSITDKPYILDKSRGWGVHYNFLKLIHGENPKVICMVRDLREVITSMEKKYRQNADKHPDIVNRGDLTGTTLFKRTNIWLTSPPIGLALDRISEILNDKTIQVLFIRYEDLLTNPINVIADVYKYLEVDPYVHDFNNITQVTVEDDNIYGIYGDHKIKEGPLSVLKNDYPVILGNEISEYIKKQYKWYFEVFGYK